MRGALPLAALALAAAALAPVLLSAACTQPGNSPPFSCPGCDGVNEPNLKGPTTIITWPCWLTLTSATFTDNCSSAGMFGDDGLQVAVTGACVVTLRFSDGITFVQPLTATSEALVVSPPCDVEGGPSCDCDAGADGDDGVAESSSDAAAEAEMHEGASE